MEVHPPVPPLPLPDAKERSVWAYDQALAVFEQKEFEVLKERLKHQQQVGEDAAANKAAAVSRVEATETPFTKEVIVLGVFFLCVFNCTGFLFFFI